MELYQENWITESDIKAISELGLNTIRVPFWYRNFYSDAQGTWIDDDPDANPGFQKLDWIITCAEKYGLYVILDMHGCPGGQSTDHCSGSARQCELFDSETYQNIMEELWVAIASRYKDSRVVAAYDIMNEGQTVEVDNVWNDPRNVLYDRMIKAIRSVDSQHIIAVQGIWDISALPLPEESGWENVIYEVHLYSEDVEDKLDELVSYREQYQVPVYVGEYMDTRYWQACRERGIHHTSWTYKGDRYTDDPWFYSYSNLIMTANVADDPYWIIQIKWGSQINYEHCIVNEKLKEVILS